MHRRLWDALSRTAALPCRPANRPPTRRWLGIAMLAGWALSAPIRGSSEPFWGAKGSVAVDTPIHQLKRGQFLWMGQSVPSGPLVMIVSLSEQQAYVYRNGILIGASTVSTGRPGYRTPTGVFTVLQKEKEHRSTLYDDAPMPYMERLTWDGVALHAGGLPGYPESHGCVHLPSEFARLLFGISRTGMTVVIANDASQPVQVAHPGYLAPVSAAGGTPVRRAPLQASEEERWQPELSPTGPVSIVLSRSSQRVVVYRNGIEIGRARVRFTGDQPLAAHALVLEEGPSDGPDPYVPDAAKFRWLKIGVPGHDGEAGTPVDPATRARIDIPADFVTRVNALLTPGATVFVTDAPLSAQNSGPVVQVVDSDPPAKGR